VRQGFARQDLFGGGAQTVITDTLPDGPTWFYRQRVHGAHPEPLLRWRPPSHFRARWQADRTARRMPLPITSWCGRVGRPEDHPSRVEMSARELKSRHALRKFEAWGAWVASGAGVRPWARYPPDFRTSHYLDGVCAYAASFTQRPLGPMFPLACRRDGALGSNALAARSLDVN